MSCCPYLYETFITGGIVCFIVRVVSLGSFSLIHQKKEQNLKNGHAFHSHLKVEEFC